jgi:peptidoglycan/LPS O-acetylase OafA/YrhL
MNRFLSAYLDFVRLSAALVVLYLHGIILGNLRISDGMLFENSHLEYSGHLAVIVFFVLSGYLVSLNAHREGNDWKRYALDRLTRLYVVIIPALIVTAAVCFFVTRLHPEAMQGALAKGEQPIRYLLNLLNLQQIWWLCADPGINGPFWSLGYEFWYYVILGVFVFCGGMTRPLLILLIAGFVGPKILALLPAWWLGVAAQRASVHASLAPLWLGHCTGFLLSLAGMLSLLLNPLWIPFWVRHLGYYPWFFSNNAPADTLYAAIVALNFYFAFRLGNDWKDFRSNLSRPITWLSKRTFSLYLFHAPLMFLIGWLSPHNRHSLTQVLLLSTLVLILCLGIAEFTELQTERLRNSLGVFTRRIPDKRL